MLNSDELNQAEMPLPLLNEFDYATQGISGDVKFDYAMVSEVELNFDKYGGMSDD